MKYQQISLAVLVFLLAGCLPHVEVAQRLEDRSLQQDLVDTLRAFVPETFRMQQHVVFHQQGREVPFNLFLEVNRTGSIRMQARGDFGSKWFDLEGQKPSPTIRTNHTPFSNQMLAKGFFADQYVIWHLPSFEQVSLWRYDDQIVALRMPQENQTWEYVFAGTTLQTIRVLQGDAIRREIHLAADENEQIHTMTIHHYSMNYRTTCEVVRLSSHTSD